MLLIGERKFTSKREALEHYKRILNSYKFGQELCETDLYELISLLKTHSNYEMKYESGILKIVVSKAKYGTKSFEIVKLDGTSEIFSYTKRINGPKPNLTLFSDACREAVQSDLRKVKLEYFKANSNNGMARCQETMELKKFEELCVDHRQPNTFSVIVDRFIELNQIDINSIEYVEKRGGPNELKDNNLKQLFREYHKLKANLRIVKKNINQKRSFQAKTKRQKRDLKIN